MHVSLPQHYCVGLSSNWVHSALAATWNPRLFNFSLTHLTLPPELFLGVNNDIHGGLLESPLPFFLPLGHLRRGINLTPPVSPERREIDFWANFTISGLKITLFRDAELSWRKAMDWAACTCLPWGFAGSSILQSWGIKCGVPGLAESSSILTRTRQENRAWWWKNHSICSSPEYAMAGIATPTLRCLMSPSGAWCSA